MVPWTDEQLREFQAAHDWKTAHPLPDGRILGKGKSSGKGGRLDPRVAAVRERLGTGLRVLEIGAGEGQHTVGLAQFCREVVAVEVRPRNVAGALIRQFVHGVGNVRNLVRDARELGDDLGRFDLVFHVGVLYHLRDPAAHLASLGALSDALLLDTHHASDDLDLPRDDLTWEGVVYRACRFTEGGWGDPFSGVERTSRWLHREDLLSILARVGFPRIEVLREVAERNGPRLGLLARR